MDHKFSEELRGPDVPKEKKRHMYKSIPKNKRWDSKEYRKFVAELPCVSCHIKDGTIVPHHLKGRASPVSGGMGYKASDLFTMPLCVDCHDKIHNGDVDLLNAQLYFIVLTQDMALQAGVLSAEYRPYGVNIL